MCGITGILSFEGLARAEQAQAMTAMLHHRGPDGEGIWVNSDSRIALGHRRLTIIDLSDAGKQPMHYADGRYTITYNGEIYNYIELKSELQSKGYSFASTSDTEVLLALYDLKKEKCLNDLDGMFAFAIWDEKEQNLFCARDRFGEKPFYYHQCENYFAFASEMKALFALGIQRNYNYRKFYDYLLYTVLEEAADLSATFYADIFQLEAGHSMFVTRDRKITKKKYWELDVGRKSEMSEDAAVKKFRELFDTSVKRRLRSDVPVGSSLSGGLDSSSIVMLIDKMKRDGRVQKTFSARFRNFVRDEGEFMQLVINKTNVEPHFVFPNADSAIKNMETIAWHQEEPFGSTSIMAQYEVMKLSKENHIKVLLDGQGADEMLAGYKQYWLTYLNQLYRTDRKKFKTEKSALVERYGELPFSEDFMFRWRASHLSSLKFFAGLKKKMVPETSGFFLGIHPDIVSVHRNKPNPVPRPATLKEHLYFSLFSRGLNELLRYADRNSMANSVEVRLPFLSHELVEFVFSLPDEMILKNGWSKYILRKGMEDVLPQEITWRKDKIGYEPPQAEWMKKKYFSDYLQASITELKKEKIIAKENPGLAWNYIALYTFMKQPFKNKPS